MNDKRKTCIKLVTDFLRTEVDDRFQEDLASQIFRTVQAHKEKGISLDYLQRKLGSTFNAIHTVCQYLIFTETLSIPETEAWTPHTKVFIYEGSQEDQPEENKTCALGATGRVKDLKAQNERRLRLLLKIVEEFAVIEHDIKLAKTLQAREQLDMGKAVSQADRKTMQRLVNKLVENGACVLLSIALGTQDEKYRQANILVSSDQDPEGPVVRNFIESLKFKQGHFLRAIKEENVQRINLSDLDKFSVELQLRAPRQATHISSWPPEISPFALSQRGSVDHSEKRKKSGDNNKRKRRKIITADFFWTDSESDLSGSEQNDLPRNDSLKNDSTGELTPPPPPPSDDDGVPPPPDDIPEHHPTYYLLQSYKCFLM